MEDIQKTDLEKDAGPQKVYQFLSRTGFLDTVADEEKLHQWMGGGWTSQILKII